MQHHRIHKGSKESCNKVCKRVDYSHIDDCGHPQQCHDVAESPERIIASLLFDEITCCNACMQAWVLMMNMIMGFWAKKDCPSTFSP